VKAEDTRIALLVVTNSKPGLGVTTWQHENDPKGNVMVGGRRKLVTERSQVVYY
jgi:hypothetical protein